MDTQTLASQFKALSEPVRLRLVCLLLQRDELCVCDLVEATGISQSVVSRHLAYLRNQDLVSATRRGVWMYYRLHESNRKGLEALWVMIAETLSDDLLVAGDRERLTHQSACCN